MDFRFTEAEEKLAQEVRDFFAKEVTDEFWDKHMAEQGCNNPYSHELHLKMAERGWFGLLAPKEYGGQERSFTELTIFLEEVGKGRGPFGNVNVISNSANFLMGGLLLYGTDEQKKKWLPLILNGQLKSSQGLTEPEAGSDLAAAQLRAVRDGDSYILNGTKIFNNAHNATHIFAVARTDPNVLKYKGISLFLVDLSSPGIAISPRFFTCGGEKRSEVSFQDVRVPKENMLGEENRGWYHLAAAMRYERTQGYRVGETEENFNVLLKTVKEMKVEGHPVTDIPWVRQSLANIATEIQVVRLLCYWVAYLQDQGKDVTAWEAPITKVYRSEIQERLANIAVDILGQYGQLEKWGSTHERIPMRGRAVELYEDSRKEEIGAGTTEVQFNIVALRGLGLPKPPRVRNTGAAT
ncbi:acyl-CoA dehydrogenase family protein [Chloroflexota bacterium]